MKKIDDVVINGKNRRIEEDVLELDNQYLGFNCTRRDDFSKKINKSMKKLVNKSKKWLHLLI